MSVHTTAFDAVFGSDPLGRFTAAIVSAVPQFDPDDTPIGHALATEFFRVPQALGDEQVEPAPAASAEVPAEALEGRTEQPVEPTSPAEQTEPTDAFPVVLAPERVSDLRFVRKMTMQLASKMRFASVQLLALFEDDLGLRAAAHANAMAARLRAALGAEALPGLAFTQPTEANAVFATLPTDAADRIRERVRFYDWDRARGEVRWMTAWDTTEADVDAFVAVVREELADGPGAPGAGA